MPAAAPSIYPDTVWTATPGVQLWTDSTRLALPRPFTLLAVHGAEHTRLLVRCVGCEAPVQGRVAPAEVLSEARPLEDAARGSLPEFALAVRTAAVRRDLAALHTVMSPTFTFTFGPGEGPFDAMAAWEWRGYRPLDRFAELLDRGLSTRDSVIWTAPPEYLEQFEYRGLRAGFRRSGSGRWEWIFLVEGS